MDAFLQAAIDEARRGLDEGGIPIGSVLVHDGRIIGRGHNRRVQKGSAILHGEMDAIENAGRQPAAVYRASTVYTTLSPCAMCSGTILLYGIPRVVVGENQTFRGEEALLRARRRGRGAAGRDLPRADAPVHRRKAGAVARGYRRGGIGRSRCRACFGRAIERVWPNAKFWEAGCAFPNPEAVNPSKAWPHELEKDEPHLWQKLVECRSLKFCHCPSPSTNCSRGSSWSSGGF
jgi:cytosine/creatinine deaminase